MLPSLSNIPPEEETLSTRAATIWGKEVFKLDFLKIGSNSEVIGEKKDLENYSRILLNIMASSELVCSSSYEGRKFSR